MYEGRIRLVQLSGEFLDAIITSLHLAIAIPIFIVGSSQARVRLQTYLLMMRLGQASLRYFPLSLE